MGWRVSSSDMWTLGTFKPTELQDAFRVRAEFRDWARQRVSSLQVVDIRNPAHKYSVLSDQIYRHKNLSWHHDVGYRNEYLIVWANKAPTQIRYARAFGDLIYQGKPWEVMLFDNRAFKHQSPSDISFSVAEKRWFIRSSVLARSVVRDVPGVYQYVT